MSVDKFKQEPQSLAVSDLQLLIAFAMRNGLDLTNHMIDTGEYYLIEYTPQGGGGMIAEGVSLRAQFNKDGRCQFVKYEKAKAHVEGNIQK